MDSRTRRVWHLEEISERVRVRVGSMEREREREARDVVWEVVMWDWRVERRRVGVNSAEGVGGDGERR